MNTSVCQQKERGPHQPIEDSVRQDHIQDASAAPVPEVADQLVQIDLKQAKIMDRLDQLGLEQTIFAELQDQCQQLSERHHEQEFLFPLFRSLIGLADRCRQELAKLRAGVRDTNLSIDVMLIIRHLLSSREADLLEVETLLSRHGVERFVHPGDRFDPKLQKCIKRSATSERGSHQQIASRHLPGYRRGTVVIRPECVNVFVWKENQQKESNHV